MARRSARGSQSPKLCPRVSRKLRTLRLFARGKISSTSCGEQDATLCLSQPSMSKNKFHRIPMSTCINTLPRVPIYSTVSGYTVEQRSNSGRRISVRLSKGSLGLRQIPMLCSGGWVHMCQGSSFPWVSDVAGGWGWEWLGEGIEFVNDEKRRKRSLSRSRLVVLGAWEKGGGGARATAKSNQSLRGRWVRT